MLDLALQGPQELSCLAEHGQVEVVVVVRDADLSGGRKTNSNGEIGHTLSSNLPQVIALIIKHLDTMSSIVTDEDLHGVVHHNTVGKLQEAGAAKLVEDVPDHVEDDHPHHLALDHNDPSTVVSGNTSWML